MKTTDEVHAELLAKGHLRADVDTVIDSFIAAVGTPDAWEDSDVDILRQQLAVWEENYLVHVIENPEDDFLSLADLRTLDRARLIDLKREAGEHGDCALVNLINAVLEG